MKPKLLKVSLQPAQSFSSRRDIGQHFFNEWHFHPEIELVYIIKGTGTQFIGDRIQQLKPGDMVLLGPELPHLFRSDKKYLKKKSKLGTEALVIHFLPNCFGGSFLKMPENLPLIKLIERSRQGLSIHGKTKQAIVQKMREVLGLTGMERLIALMQILHVISSSKETKLISSRNYEFIYSQKESIRLNNIYQHILNNFHNEIRLDSVASIANMGPQSFCRYFKSRTKKTFTRFLMEVRVRHACKLLTESEMGISEICFESGYNNFSNFNRQFKEVTKMIPSKYRSDFNKI